MKKRGYEIGGGDAMVIEMGKMSITGNVIPINWLREITFQNGKPNVVACMLLADIVYWYRPIEERDETSGNVIGLRKKFAADLLQRSYSAFADMYGFTKRQVADNIKILRDLDLIGLHFRTIETKDGPISNVLFISININKLKEITYKDDPLLRSNVIPYYGETEEGLTVKRNTYTENTTESTIIDKESKDSLSGSNKKPAKKERKLTEYQKVCEGIDRLAEEVFGELALPSQSSMNKMIRTPILPFYEYYAIKRGAMRSKRDDPNRPWVYSEEAINDTKEVIAAAYHKHRAKGLDFKSAESIRYLFHDCAEEYNARAFGGGKQTTLLGV